MNYLKDADNTYISGDSTGVITLYMKVAKIELRKDNIQVHTYVLYARCS